MAKMSRKAMARLLAETQAQLKNQKADEITLSRQDIEGRLSELLGLMLDEVAAEAAVVALNQAGHGCVKKDGVDTASEFGVYMARVFFAYAVFGEAQSIPLPKGISWRVPAQN